MTFSDVYCIFLGQEMVKGRPRNCDLFKGYDVIYSSIGAAWARPAKLDIITAHILLVALYPGLSVFFNVVR